MAQSGSTPIALYNSATTTNVPLAANLASGELAINTADGKLFYKDSGGVVQVIGWKTTPATAGGTGQTSYAVGDLLYASTTTALSKLADVATGSVLTSGGVGVAPAWGKVALATAVSGSLPAANGGTGQTVYAVGDLLYASTTTALSKLADVATGNAVISGGVGVAPAWGKIGLTTHVSGTLPIANGGTNSTATATAGGVGYGTGTAHAYTAAGTAGQVLISAAGAAPTWSSGTGTGSVVFSNGPTLTGSTTIQGLTIGLGAGAISTSTALGVNAIAATANPAANVTAVGYTALSSNATSGSGGFDNTAVGSNALKLNDFGYENTAVGSGAMQTNTTGYDSVAIGFKALNLSEGFNGVVAVGPYALSTATGAIYNTVAMGYNALKANTTGNYNSAIGASAMGNFTTGSNNTAVGNYALLGGSGASGSNNVAVGNSSMEAMSSGSDNTAIGINSAAANTTGLYNTAIGSAALYGNTTGSSNTAVGQGALYAGNGGSNNTVIGYSAGSGVYGSNNSFFGNQSGSGVSSGSNNVIIGSFTGATSPIGATGSNWIILSDGVGAVRQAIDPAGNAQTLAGANVVYAPAPAAISTTVTLTNANLQAQLINTTGTTYTVTMPLGSTLDTLITWAGTNLGFDFSVINTASGTITMAANTGVTTLGGLTIATGTSAHFRIRRITFSSYALYRIS